MVLRLQIHGNAINNVTCSAQLGLSIQMSVKQLPYVFVFAVEFLMFDFMIDFYDGKCGNKKKPWDTKSYPILLLIEMCMKSSNRILMPM